MGDDLVAVEIEIDPMVGAAAFGAAEQFAVEAPRGGKVVDRKGEVEGRKAHCAVSHCHCARSEAIELNEACLFLYAFLCLCGAASAFAFEPTGLWPLLLLAFALPVRDHLPDQALWRAC